MKAVFAAGCFWGVEHFFRQIAGVTSAVSGYCGGEAENPTYKQVCTGRTGHAEVVQVEFDPAQVSFEQLVEAFWNCHDPTTLNRQGPDVGTQYRSAIYYLDEDQRRIAEKSKAELTQSGRFARPIVTEITAAGPFYPAEQYHQRYFEKHGLQGCHF
jgi:peptide-methionine (S)-S-oxide reductase